MPNNNTTCSDVGGAGATLKDALDGLKGAIVRVEAPLHRHQLVPGSGGGGVFLGGGERFNHLID